MASTKGLWHIISALAHFQPSETKHQITLQYIIKHKEKPERRQSWFFFPNTQTRLVCSPATCNSYIKRTNHQFNDTLSWEKGMKLLIPNGHGLRVRSGKDLGTLIFQLKNRMSTVVEWLTKARDRTRTRLGVFCLPIKKPEDILWLNFLFSYVHVTKCHFYVCYRRLFMFSYEIKLREQLLG